jgi:hypothetical protein
MLQQIPQSYLLRNDGYYHRHFEHPLRHFEHASTIIPFITTLMRGEIC